MSRHDWFESAPFAYHEIDAEGIVRVVNEAECRLLGFRREEILGRPVWEMVAPEERETSRCAVQEKLLGLRPLVPFTRNYLDRSGRQLVLEIHESAIRNADGSIRGLRSFLLDVTDRVQAERLQQRSQMLLQAAEQIAGLCAWERDLASGEEFWSQEVYRLTGLQQGEPMSHERFLELVWEQDREELKYCLHRAVVRGEAYDHEFRLLRADGAVRVFRARGRVTGGSGKAGRLIGTYQDVTEQKKLCIELQGISDVLEGEREALKLLARGAALDDVLRAIIDNVTYRWPEAVCSVHLLNDEGRFYRRVAPSFFRGGQSLCAGFPCPDGGAAAAAVHFNQLVVCEDAAVDAVCARVREPMSQMGVVSEWAAPLRRHQGGPIGAISLYHWRKVVPREEDLRSLEAAAELAALACERKREETQLRQSRQRFQMLAEQAPVGIFVTDGEGKTLFRNRHWYEISGLSPERDESVECWKRVLHPEDRERVIAAWEEALRRGVEFAMEYRYLNPRGQTIWVSTRAAPLREDNGAPAGYIGTVHDISARKRVEESLRASERQLRELVENLPAGAVYRKGDELLLNKAVEQMTGYGREEISSLDAWFDLLFRENATRARRLYERHRVRGFPRTRTVRIYRPDGETRWIEAAAYIRGETEVWLLQDVTRRREAERKLQLLIQELQQARLKAEAAARAKAEFLAHMSHEIRTPMHGVLGMAELLLGTDLDAEQRECAETIQSSAQSLLSILNDILDISKIDAGKMRVERLPFQLEPAVGEVFRLLQPAAREKDLETVLHITPGTPENVIADPARLRQILLNLLGNAVKFTERGFVSLKVAFEHTGKGQGCLRLEVRDTGIGIPKHVQKDLFQQFVQADASTTRRYGGTGLGLAITKRLLDLLGGAIALESEPGRGTLFTVHLPVEVAEPAERPPAPPAGNALVFSQLKEQRLALADALRIAGYEVSLEEAIQAGWQPPQKPDIVVLDWSFGLSLGQMRQIVRRVSAAVKAPILVLGSQQGRSAEDDLMASGARCVLHKPVGPEALAQACVRLRSSAGAPPLLRPSHEDARPLGMRVLLAEDNRINQRLAMRVLERCGCQVVLASNGREAVEAWSADPAAIDLVLMDCQMPEMDGFEAAAEIRRLERSQGGQRIPIIALTANAMEGDRLRCLEAGMDDFVAKPVSIGQLRHALEKWRPPQPPALLSDSGNPTTSSLAILSSIGHERPV